MDVAVRDGKQSPVVVGIEIEEELTVVVDVGNYRFAEYARANLASDVRNRDDLLDVVERVSITARNGLAVWTGPWPTGI